MHEIVRHIGLEESTYPDQGILEEAEEAEEHEDDTKDSGERFSHRCR